LLGRRALPLIGEEAFANYAAAEPWLAAALPVAAAAVCWRVFSRREDDAAASAAAIDRKLGLGGLLMSLGERSGPAWADRLPVDAAKWRDALPKLRPTRFASWVGPAAAFTAVAFLIPPREAVSTPTTGGVATRQAAERLEEILDAFREAEIADEEEISELEEQVEELTERAESEALTHETWESFDTLEESFRQRFDGSRRALAEAIAAADGALTAAADGLPLDDAISESLAQALAATSGIPGMNAASLPSDLRKLLADAKASGTLSLPSDAAARKKLLDALKKKLSECQGNCESASAGCEGLCLSDGWDPTLKADGDGKPGRGGLGRGKADAPFWWGDESDGHGLKFEATPLPPGEVDEAADEVLGLSRRAPELEDDSVAARNVGRDRGVTAEGSTARRKLRPRHRDVVRDYFATDDGESGNDAGSR
ncbi:MAG: hypothetical protein AAGJ97_01870, partial [Planctomycetota bacterium]